MLLRGIVSWFGFHPQRGLSSAQPLDLIVVLDGGSSRLAAAERRRQRILLGNTQQASRHEPNLLLIRCPRSSPIPKTMRELLQGYDTATHITALADWLRRRQAKPPQRIWIATDLEHTARATLLACIALAGRGRTPQAGSRCPANEPLARHRQHRWLAGASGRCPQTVAVRLVRRQALRPPEVVRCLPQRSGLRPRERRWYACIVNRAASDRRG